jgi:hypothetical protein
MQISNSLIKTARVNRYQGNKNRQKIITLFPFQESFKGIIVFLAKKTMASFT